MVRNPKDKDGTPDNGDTNKSDQEQPSEPILDPEQENQTIPQQEEGKMDNSENKKVVTPRHQSRIDVSRYSTKLEEHRNKGKKLIDEAEDMADSLLTKTFEDLFSIKVSGLEEGIESFIEKTIEVDTSSKAFKPELVIKLMERLIEEAFNEEGPFSVEIERIGNTNKAKLTITYEKKI